MKQKRTFYFLLFIFILGLLTGLLWPKKKRCALSRDKK